MIHTKGLAEVKELPCSKGGTMKFLLVSGTGIAVMCGKVGGAKVEEANARRLAALWNAAEELGLTTEAIEKGVIQDSYHALADHLVGEIVSGKIQRLEAEKAESEHALGFAIDRVERLEAEKAEMLEALEWYAEKVLNCRKITAEGDAARHDLDHDGGKRARMALEKARGEE